MKNSANLLEPAVYSAHEICRLFDVHKNNVAALVEAGTIPKPLPTTTPHGRRLWLKGEIDRYLGIDKSNADLSEIVKQAVKDAINEIAREQNWDKLVQVLLNADKSV